MKENDSTEPKSDDEKESHTSSNKKKTYFEHLLETKCGAAVVT